MTLHKHLTVRMADQLWTHYYCCALSLCISHQCYDRAWTCSYHCGSCARPRERYNEEIRINPPHTALQTSHICSVVAVLRCVFKCFAQTPIDPCLVITYVMTLVTTRGKIYIRSILIQFTSLFLP